MDDAEFRTLQQQLCRRELAKLEQSFSTGKDSGAVLHAIFLCFHHEVEVPEWAQKAFRVAYTKGLHGKVRTRSWSEVLGKPPRTRTQFKKFLRAIQLPPVVYGMVAEAKNEREPVDSALFERIGKTLGTNRDVIAKAYREWTRVRGKL